MQPTQRRIPGARPGAARQAAYVDVPFSYPFQSPSIAAASGRSDQIQTMDSDADFYLCRALFTGITSPSTIELRDHFGDSISDFPIVANTPVDFTCSPPRRIPATGRIQMGFTNNSGGALTPRVRLEGFKRYRFSPEESMSPQQFWPAPAQLGDLMPTDTPPGYEDRFYIQVLPPTTIVAGAANVQYNVAIQTGVEGDFIWRALAYTGDSVLTDPGLIAIRWQDADRYYRSNARIPAVLIAGPIQNPAPIFPEIVIPPRGQILFELENLNALDQTNFQLLLIGVMRRKLA